MGTETTTSEREFFGVPNADGYVPVLLETLRIDSIPDFDLYNRVGKEYILYRRGKHPFTEEHRRALVENGVRALYVPEKEIGRYWDYLKENVTVILSDPQLPPQRKAEVFHASAIGLTRNVFATRGSEEALKTAGEVVKGSAQLLLEGRQGFHAFLQMVGTDANFYSHAVNVCTYGIALARDLGLPHDQLAELGTGLLLHDLGMIGVPPETVKKAQSLTSQEWEPIYAHPERGLIMYEEGGGKSDIAKAVILNHHERMDGSGYPRGLLGPEIPLVGRIAGVVDVFDALTTERPYRPALSTFQALVCMKRDLRAGLDQDLVQRLIRILGPA